MFQIIAKVIVYIPEGKSNSIPDMKKWVNKTVISIELKHKIGEFVKTYIVNPAENIRRPTFDFC